MHKVDITTLFTGVCSAVLMANAITINAVHQAQAKSQNTSIAQASKLPETKKLMQDDQALPTMNRTQAMRLEAETGHINQAADNVLKPKTPLPREHRRSVASKEYKPVN